MKIKPVKKMNHKIQMLAEWDLQAKVIITWPHRESDWKDNITDIWETYQKLALAIAEYDKLTIIAQDNSHMQEIKNSVLRNSHENNIDFQVIATNDTWIRDYGPISCKTSTGETRFANFLFNAYGEKYPYLLDNQVNHKLHANRAISNITDIPLILEGGSIETDGKGVLLTTTSCLLNNNRNGMSSHTIIRELKTYLGIEKVCFLENTHLPGDDTDGHIDNFVRFVDANTIFYSADPKSNLYEQLQELSNCSNKPYELVPIPHVENLQLPDRTLPASYLNFLITNNKIILPIFSISTDRAAIEIFEQYKGSRIIEAIDARSLLFQGGGIHCGTMQIAK